MVWNPSPEVAAARDIGKRFKKNQVIILMVDFSKETLEYASYGDTPQTCADAQRLADIVYEAVMNDFNSREEEPKCNAKD